MFWTKLMKTVAKVILVVMLILTVLTAIRTVRLSVGTAFVTLITGIAGSFIAVAGIMLVCEISENICAIKNHLTGSSENTEPINFNSIAHNLGVNLNSNAQSAPAQPVTSVQPAAPVQPSAPAEPAQTDTAQETTQSNPVDLSK